MGCPHHAKAELCVKECSNGPALGDRHLENADGLAISQGMEQMRSQEVLENTAVLNVNAGHDLAVQIMM